MKEDFLAEFMGNESARARLLRVFVFDPEHYLPIKDAAKRAGISAASAGKEVHILEKWGIVKKGKATSITLSNGTVRKVSAQTKVDTWGFDPEFKYARALSAFVREISPMRYEN